jgi:hypothetical protein
MPLSCHPQTTPTFPLLGILAAGLLGCDRSSFPSCTISKSNHALDRMANMNSGVRNCAGRRQGQRSCRRSGSAQLVVTPSHDRVALAAAHCCTRCRTSETSLRDRTRGGYQPPSRDQRVTRPTSTEAGGSWTHPCRNMGPGRQRVLRFIIAARVCFGILRSCPFRQANLFLGPGVALRNSQSLLSGTRIGVMRALGRRAHDFVRHGGPPAAAAGTALGVLSMAFVPKYVPWLSARIVTSAGVMLGNSVIMRAFEPPMSWKSSPA